MCYVFFLFEVYYIVGKGAKKLEKSGHLPYQARFINLTTTATMVGGTQLFEGAHLRISLKYAQNTQLSEGTDLCKIDVLKILIKEVEKEGENL